MTKNFPGCYRSGEISNVFVDDSIQMITWGNLKNSYKLFIFKETVPNPIFTKFDCLKYRRQLISRRYLTKGSEDKMFLNHF